MNVIMYFLTFICYVGHLTDWIFSPQVCVVGGVAGCWREFWTLEIQVHVIHVQLSVVG